MHFAYFAQRDSESDSGSDTHFVFVFLINNCHDAYACFISQFNNHAQ